jgi:hypothetical protein
MAVPRALAASAAPPVGLTRRATGDPQRLGDFSVEIKGNLVRGRASQQA